MLSIIVPCFNQHEMTRECLEALREHTQDWELILVDNGSDPPLTMPYQGFVETHIIRNETNKGFPYAVNQALATARGGHICLLNNDVVVTPGWADILRKGLAEFSIVGPVTNFCAGHQRVLVPSYDNRMELAKTAEGWAEEHRGQVQEVRWLIGFCLAFTMQAADDIGPFDTTLWPCCGEEIDWCLRGREKGHHAAILHECYVHHEGSQTFRAMGLDYAEICASNDEHLAARWGKDFWHRQALDASPVPTGVCLNLGCGYRPLPGFINIDCRQEVQPDLVCDVREGLPYPESSVDLVRADDFLEHLPADHVIPVMEDIWRVLKPGGLFESRTPSTDGRGAFQDPTHRSFWNRNSWLYYSDPGMRRLYGIRADFELESITENDPDPAVLIIHTHVIARARKCA